MLLYLKHLKECVGALGAAILLLVPFQNFLDVLLSEIGWIYQAGNRIIWSKLVLYRLMLETLGKEDHHTVRERMTIVNFHVSLHLELIRELGQSNFELHLIPENHWWRFIIVFACAHVLVSRILLFLFEFLDILGLYYLLQLFSPIFSQLLGINQCLTFVFNLLDEIVLLINRVLSQLLEVLDRVLVDVESVAQRCTFGPLYESFGLSSDPLFICGGSQVDIYIISSQSRDGQSHLIISVARFIFLLRTVRRQEVVITFESGVTLHSIFELKLKFGVHGIELEGCSVHGLRSQTVVSPSQLELVPLVLEFVLSMPEEVA